MNRTKIILGTVQLGMNYGINNQFGKPTEEMAFEILDYAINHQIEIVDTAVAYGNSEDIIGNFHRKQSKKFRVCTKLIFNEEFEEDVHEIAESSLAKLEISYLDVLYLHRFEQAKNLVLLEKFVNLKELGKIKKIGISIYEPNELEYIIRNLKHLINVVQIPYNILDNARWDDLIKAARLQGIEIYARSVFLQGLLFKESFDPVIKRLHAEEYVELIKEIAQEKGVTREKILMDFCLKGDLDALLIGCETKEQLIHNAAWLEEENSLGIEDMKHIRAQTKNIDSKIIDPRRW